MFNLPDTEKIYFSEIKEYFNEVMSCYINKSYRAANVMLYSIVICDLMLKLKELRDLYDDKKADEILVYVEKERQAGRTNSSWEKALLDKIFKETKLLDLESKSHIDRLYDDRNLSAHPALDQDYLLITPSQETTIANIKNVLKDVLIKPPIFINNMVDRITNELARNRDIFGIKDPESFDKYIKSAYLDRMSDLMKKQVFKAFWKFIFLKADNPYKEYRDINFMFLSCLYRYNRDLLKSYLRDHSQEFKLINDKHCAKYLCYFLSENEEVYDMLDEIVKDILEHNILDNDDLILISWFTYDNIEIFLKNLSDLRIFRSGLDIYSVILLKEYFINTGEIRKLIDLLIYEYSNSKSFDYANCIFDIYLDDLLKYCDASQIIRIIEGSNENSQVYDRRKARIANKQIYDRAKEIFGDNFDISKYENFYI